MAEPFVRESLYTGQATKDIHGKITSVRVFHTDYKSFPAAIIDPRFPRVGDEHPIYNDVFCDRIGSTLIQDGSLEMTFQYSPDGSFAVLDPPDQNPGDPLRWGWGRTSVEIKFPTYALATKSVSDGVDGSIKVWEKIEATKKEKRMTLVASVTVTKLSIPAIMAILDQEDAIHEIAGIKMVFQSPDINPKSNLWDEINYMWVCDQGTIDPRLGPGLPPGRIYSGPGTSGRIVLPPNVGNGLCRLPFTDLEGYPGINAYDANQVPFAPEIIGIPYAVEDLTGWLTLPGLIL